MYIMNLIQDICLTKNYINNIPKWKFISKNKQIKKLNKNISEFLNLDIFNASNNIITFLLSLGKEITKHVDGYLWYDDTCISIEVLDNEEIFKVDYYPRSNRFEIGCSYMHYSIYRNTKISNRINKMWGPLTDKIKKRYLNIILQMAEFISLKS